MCRRYVFVLLALFTGIAFALVACNTGEPDAVRVMQANSDGTIAALNNHLKTLEATNAAVSTTQYLLETARTRVADEQARNTQLLSQQNATTNPFNPVSAAPIVTQPGGATGPTPGVVIPGGNVAITGTPAPVGTPGGLTIDRVTTSKGTNSADGCALNETTAFTSADSRIWVVAYIRNLRAGVVFTARWALADTPKEYSYTSNFTSARTCINFYIEPRTLNITAGTYTVTIATTDGLASPPASFTVQ